MNSTKIIALILSIVATVNYLSAQTDCTGDKYANPNYFSNVKVTRNIVYGSNIGVTFPTAQSLRLDVYEPAADTMPGRHNRPLIILAHGGSFIGGDKNECESLCNSFAKMGYVAVTIDYRTGIFVPNEVKTTLAVLRAMHDMRAAVRYFRKDAASANAYGVDTNRIIIGGISAGAIAAIHVAYLDEDSEIPAYLVNDTAGLGGIEGVSGNPGYSSKAHGVVNYAGAIGDTLWINAGDIPITSFHYSGDQTVPYDTREVSVNGIPTGLIASGSGSMKTRLENEGVVNELTTYSGSGHVDYLNGSDYDTVINSTMMFLYNNVVCKQTTSAVLAEVSKIGMNISPNPSAGVCVLRFNETPDASFTIEVYNSMGKLVFHSENQARKETTLDLSHLSKGVYLVSAKTGNGQKIGIEKLIIR